MFTMNVNGHSAMNINTFMFTLNLPLRMVWWVRMEVREQSRIQSSKMLLQRKTVVF